MSTGIRAADPSDSLTLARLRYEFRVTVGPAVENEAVFVRRCQQWMAEHLTPSGAWRCWIAERDGATIGHVWLHVIEKVPNPAEEPERHAYITNLFVHEAERGHGIGTQLLARALAWCRERDEIHAAILWTAQESRSLYERHGFKVRDDLMELILR